MKVLVNKGSETIAIIGEWIQLDVYPFTDIPTINYVLINQVRKKRGENLTRFRCSFRVLLFVSQKEQGGRLNARLDLVWGGVVQQELTACPGCTGTASRASPAGR